MSRRRDPIGPTVKCEACEGTGERKIHGGLRTRRCLHCNGRGWKPAPRPADRVNTA